MIKHLVPVGYKIIVSWRFMKMVSLKVKIHVTRVMENACKHKMVKMIKMVMETLPKNIGKMIKMVKMVGHCFPVLMT